MGIRNPKKEELGRLESKTLDARFLQTIREGLGCSPFEAAAVLEVVREVYLPFLDGGGGTAPPHLLGRGHNREPPVHKCAQKRAQTGDPWNR